MIAVKSKRATIKDLESKNKTFIGGKQRVTSEIELPAGAVITFGLVEAKLVAAPQRAATKKLNKRKQSKQRGQ
jgi:pSer/pThr/pTyr-binding forkhead associated (FHA) protein